MFDSIFAKKKLRPNALREFGFAENGGTYSYREKICGGFVLTVSIVGGTVETNVVDSETGEEYVLYKTAAAGAFVGEVRSGVESVLQKIAAECFEPDVFKQEQTKRVIEFVRRTFGDELEFLWEKFDDNAVWRRKDTQKWYAAILTVQKCKLGVNSGEKAEIIDLRIQREKMDALLSKPNFYPGWHMNKKSWFTVILDGSVPDSELFALIQNSYALAVK